ESRVADLSWHFLRLANDFLPSTQTMTIAGEAIDTGREAMRITQAHEDWKTFGSLVSARNPGVGAGVAERMKIASSIDGGEVNRCKIVLDEVTERMQSATADRTILVLPTCPTIAPRLDASPDELERFRVNTMRLICLASISGLPQITVPIGLVDGAPVGLSF